MRSDPPATGERGFALVETLVAAAVISAMLAMLCQTIAADAHLTQALRERRRATMLARSVLDEATTSAEAFAPDRRGRWNGMAWRVLRSSYGGGARDGGPPLERVAVRVRDGTSGKLLIELATLRLVR